MATINASTGADIIVPSNNGDTYRGLAGNDTYIISNAISGKVTIVDTNGSDTIQLVDGLSIASSKFSADSVQLTLSNGAIIQINGADNFTYEVGGNVTTGATGSSNTYAQLASAMGVDPLPTGSTISDGSSGSVSGSALSTGSVSYSLSASSTNVAEGGSLTYTVTASAAADTATTLTYNVIGDDNSGSVDKATGSDLDSLSGTVTIAAGETSGTFSISPTADDLNEGLEGIKVTVFDATLDSIGSSTALISNTASIASSSTTLTASADVIAGGAGDDIVSGIIQATMANVLTTVNAGDVIDGGDGNDTLKIAATGDDGAGAISINALEVTNVETISVNNFATGGGTHTVDMALITGVTSVGLNASSAAGDTAFSNVPTLVDIFMRNGDADLQVTYIATAVAGTTDVQNITVNNVASNSNALTVDKVETVNLTSTGLKSVIDTLATAAATTLNIDGDAKLTIGVIPPTAGTIDASTMTGDLVISAYNITPLSGTFSGSQGNDTVTVTSGELTSVRTLEGNGGIDTLVLLAQADWNLLTYGNVTGFEVLGSGVVATYDFSKLAGGVAVLSAAASDGGAGTVIFTNMPSTSTGTITGTEGFDLLLTQDSADDTANVTVGAGAAGGNGITVVDPVALSEFETVNLISGGLTDSVVPIESAQMTTLNVSGQGVSVAITNATGIKTIDGSAISDAGGTGLTITGNPALAAFGGVTITGTDAGLDNLLGGAGPDTISGGGVADSLSGAGGADIIHGGSGGDLIIGGAGIDTLHGDGGNDRFIVGTTGDFTSLASAETISGGDGTDTLIFGGTSTLATGAHIVASVGTAYTIAATDLHNVDVEQIKSFEDGLFTLTVDDTFYTNSNQTVLKIDNSTAAGDITITASSLSAANSIDVASNGGATVDTFTGGKGDDIFRFDSTAATGWATGDTVAGGGGTDKIIMTLISSMTAVANTNLVSRVEEISFIGSGAITANYSLNNGTFVTETIAGVKYSVVGVVDASGMVGTGGLTLNGALETDSKMTITGGRGADIITGGSKADTINGGYGADNITGGPGIDILSGGAGNDTFTVATGTNFLLMATAETVDGGSGALDTIDFTEAADLTVAAADLVNMTGIEIIEMGGTGDDSVTVSDQVFANNGATSLKVENSSTGTFTVNAAGVSAANSLNVQYDIAAAGIAVVDTITGGSGDDTVLFTDGRQWTSTDIINGGLGTDTITVMLGTTSTDALAAGSQTGLSNIENINLIVGGANTANAAITTADANFAATDATINGAGVPGVLTINAAAETDSNVTILGGTGNDILTGGTNPANVDTITGGLGDDTITGGRGSDILSGGAGADVFTYTATNQSNTSTPDSITDFVSKTDKIAITVDLTAKVSAQTYNTTLTAAKADVTAAQNALTGVAGQILYVTGEEALYLNDTSDNLLTSLDYKININPAATATATVAEGDINMTISGSTTASNTITTGSGTDTITGGNVADIITSGAGADILDGGTGNDIITGGTGADTIDVGTGLDTVVYTTLADGISAVVTITNATSTADDFAAVAGTNVDSIGNAWAVASDFIKIDGTLEARLEANAVDTAIANNASNLDFNATGIAILTGSSATLAADNFGDVSEVIAKFNASNKTPQNAAAGDEILFTLEGNTANLTGLYYLKDVDGNGDIGVGDEIALLAIIADDTLTATEIIL
jgi:Ca2+-binding RTX toxin-like protein